MVSRRKQPAAPANTPAAASVAVGNSVALAGYDAKRDDANRRSRESSQASRDIGPPPAPLCDKTRKKLAASLELFLKTCFPHAFPLPFSPDHQRVIAKIERAIIEGGLSAVAMPRGYGKSTMSERAIIWAILTGRREFVCLIGATERFAKNSLKKIKVELETNPQLLAFFPREVWGIKQLENNGRRCAGQLCGGEQTRITWAADKLVMPTIAGSQCSGSVISVVGLTGALRGQSETRRDGKIIRPSLILLDDPQTRESASSVTQSEERAAIIAGDVLGMAGPGVPIAAVMPCTVIRKGDLADTMLDRQKHPQWQGERTKMVYAFPTDEALWEQYHELRSDSFRNDGNGSEATKFYKKNRRAMDAGLVVAWPERFNPGELSAIQHAMNLKFRDELAFAAEYQNDPQEDDSPEIEVLTADEIAARFNGVERRVVPDRTEHITAMIDVHDSVLFWALLGFQSDFAGAAIDYGTFPDQHKAFFTLRKAPRTLQAEFPGIGKDGAVAKGLELLIEQLAGREYLRGDGAVMPLGKGLIDSGYNMDVVHLAIRRSKHANTFAPSRGKGITAAMTPMHEYAKKPGDRVGHHWRLQAQKGVGLRYVLFDANYWKGFFHKRLATDVADKGAFQLFGHKPHTHHLLSQHLSAEMPKKAESQGRTVIEWHLRPGRDNHWLDCFVGCFVAAQMLGCQTGGFSPARDQQPRIVLSQLQANRRRR